MISEIPADHQRYVQLGASIPKVGRLRHLWSFPPLLPCNALRVEPDIYTM